jgi:alpha-tubulin suppressor-like RCC1 family protein
MTPVADAKELRMKHVLLNRSARVVAIAALSTVLVACGSGSGSAPPPPAPPPATVGPAGGTVNGPSGAQVVIPAGALSAATAIAVDQSSTGAPALPAGTTTFGAMFAFTPHGTSFAVPVTITVPFNAAAVSAGATPVLYKTNGAGTWERVANATVNAGTVTAQVTSFSWIIVGNVPPIITTQPANASVVEPATASFSVIAIGTPPLLYQWQKSDDGGQKFIDIPAANAASYATPATRAASDNGDRFRVRVSNLEGSTTSQAATLTVTVNVVAPAITTQPQSQSVAVGASATFSAVASGTAPSYQWQRSSDGTNWTDIAGATNASYTLANVQATDNGAQFRVRATNSAGTATSNAATLTVTTAPPPASGAGRIAAGNGFSLAVNAAGVPYSWGADGTGQLGNGTPNADRSIAAPVGAFNAVRAVAAGGGSQAIALRTDGTVWAWGYGGSVNCDFGATFPLPVQISGATGIVALSTGDAHTLLLRNDGAVLAFGCNDSGQLGRAGTAPAASAVVVAGLPPITAVAAGGALSLALDASGNVWSWGRGALGDSTGLFAPRHAPAQIAGLTGVTAIAAAYNHALALRSNGSVWAWGSNGNGKLGIGNSVANQFTPVVSGLASGITAIAAGGDNSMALRSDGVVLVAGINEVGQLGAFTPGFSNTWVAVPGVTTAVAIAAGAQSATSHLFAARADGSVIGWGWNNFGQVGTGATGAGVVPPAVVTGLNLN